MTPRDPQNPDELLATVRRRDVLSRARVDQLTRDRRAAELEERLRQREDELVPLAHPLEEAKSELVPAQAPDGELPASQAERDSAHANRVRELSRIQQMHTLELDAARREVGRLDEQVAQEAQARVAAERELQKLRQLLERAHTQLTETEAKLEPLLKRADAARDELESSRHQLALTHAQLGVVQAEAAALAAREESQRAAAGEARADLAQQLKQNEALRSQLDAADRKRQRVMGEYSVRVRTLEQRISTLTVALRDTKSDIERALASRAWRIGHRITKTASRAAMRPIRTKGSLAQALARIERLEGALLPEGAGPSPDAQPEATTAGPAALETGETSSSSNADAPQTMRPAEPSTPQQVLEVERYRAALANELRFRLGPVPELDQWPAVSAIVVTRDGRSQLERLFECLERHTDYPGFELIVVDNCSSDGSLALIEAARPGFDVRAVQSDRNLSFSEANALGVDAARGELLLFINNDVEPFESGWLKEMVAALQGSDAALVGATLVRADSDTAADPQPLIQHRAIRFRWRDGIIKGYNDSAGQVLWDADFATERQAPAVTAACMLMRRDEFTRIGGFDVNYIYGGEDIDLGLRLRTVGADVRATGRAVLAHQESATQAREDDDVRRLNRAHNRRVFIERWGARIRREYRLSRLRRSPVWTDGRGPHAVITVTSLAQDDRWGDWVTGHELGEALRAVGWQVSYAQRQNDEWYSLPEDVDYVVALMDTFDLRRVPDEVTTIAWIRNWTERWIQRPWFARADVILASSRGSADLIERATGRSSTIFPLAANPARFAPRPPTPELAADYIFTGNRWGEQRAIESTLAPRKGERVRIYGRGWDRIRGLSRLASGELPYERLADAYASAKLVIDDTQAPTLPYGAVNGRVFEALAAGSLVVTNCQDGAHELFDDEFPVWSSRETLRAKLDELLSDEQLRDSLALRYRHRVLREHTYAQRADTLQRLLIEHEHKPSFCLKIGAPNREVAHNWGDLHFAEAFARELRRRGHRTRIETLDEWESEAGLFYDVVVHLKGLSRYHVKPGQCNVLWSISHPSELTGEECDAYDLVLVASKQFATELRERTRTPVDVLEQATDPRVFYPDPKPEYAHDLVYVANSRNVLRPIVRDLLPTEHDLAIWGTNWDGLIDMRYVVADHIPNEELRHVYSSAKIVLCDHWDDMREHGYVSNRVYDALACGACVISDDVTDLTSRLGDSVVTYREPGELPALVDEIVEGGARDQAHVARALASVANHTFEHRVQAFLAALSLYPASIADRASAPFGSWRL